jgi:hypothetical protein
MLCQCLGKLSYLSVCSILVADALLSFLTGLLTAMFSAAGTLMNVSQRAQNEGKVRVPDPHRLYYLNKQMVCCALAPSVQDRRLGCGHDGTGPATYGTQATAIGLLHLLTLSNEAQQSS